MKTMRKLALLSLTALSILLLLTVMTVSASASSLPTEGECGDGGSACKDENNDHVCDYCTAPTSTCGADEDENHVCDVCGVELAHSFSWFSDKDEHWELCTCGKEQNRHAHNCGDGVLISEPTENSYGIREFTCADCGYTYRIHVLYVAPPASGDGQDDQIDQIETVTKHFSAPVTVTSKKGCGASVTAASTVILITLGAALTLCKKKKD